MTQEITDFRKLITLADEKRTIDELEVLQELFDVGVPLLINLKRDTPIITLTEFDLLNFANLGFEISDKARIIISETFSRLYNLTYYIIASLDHELTISDLVGICETELNTEWLNPTQKQILVAVLADSTEHMTRLLPYQFHYEDRQIGL